MFKEFFLRRRAFKVGQNLRQMHESSGSSVLTGQRVVNLAIDHWKDYCEAQSPPRYWSAGELRLSDKERKLLADDYLRAICLQAFTDGYKADDAPHYWPDESIKE